MREKEEGLEKIEIEAGKERVIERKADHKSWFRPQMVIMVIVIASGNWK